MMKMDLEIGKFVRQSHNFPQKISEPTQRQPQKYLPNLSLLTFSNTQTLMETQSSIPLINLSVNPVQISNLQALDLMDSETIIVTPYSLLADTEPDLLSFLMVQDFNLQLSPMHDLHTDNNAYMSYIVQRLEDIVSAEGSHWHAVSLIGANNDQLVFAIPSLVKLIQARNKPIYAVDYIEPASIEEPLSPDAQYNNKPPSQKSPPTSSTKPNQQSSTTTPTEENNQRIKRTYNKRKSTLPNISTGLSAENLISHNITHPPNTPATQKKPSDTDAEISQVRTQVTAYF